MNDETQLSNSDRFRKMAERIDLNKDDGFGGSCVIVPPTGAGSNPIEILIVLPAGGVGDLVQFFSMVSSRIQREVDEASNQVAMQQGFGRGR
jgi:hypothetical protein